MLCSCVDSNSRGRKKTNNITFSNHVIFTKQIIFVYYLYYVCEIILDREDQARISLISTNGKPIEISFSIGMLHNRLLDGVRN